MNSNRGLSQVIFDFYELIRFRLFIVLVILIASIFFNDIHAQNCPTSGKVKKVNATGTSIELNIENTSGDFEINIFDSTDRVYIYSESKLDPGFYIQNDIEVIRIRNNELRISGLAVPFSKDRFQILVITESCRLTKLDIRE